MLYRKLHFDIDYALVMLTPPDKHGFCSLGATVSSARSAIQNAKIIVGKSTSLNIAFSGQINPSNPITYGDSTVHVSKIDFLVHGQESLKEMPNVSPSEAENKICQIIAETLVEDGATLQLGQFLFHLLY